MSLIALVQGNKSEILLPRLRGQNDRKATSVAAAAEDPAKQAANDMPAELTARRTHGAFKPSRQLANHEGRRQPPPLGDN